ncbi:MAG: DNA (cytosine-5-)-methyltransferase [Actinobacteria bacterium]|uniref:DNA (cytosine-5-)-methyltransferase n=1 Tax=freshwater metagenome TaxID=449393 RepID=A0A6J6IMQ7_9ZZZZ|nr:DNA (cytosine-5-)-methyltransferase [Actinomycetota bacterium]
MSKKPAFTYVDLFAGCGGLSLGLESQGGKLIVAVERSDMAAETFYHNLVRPLSSKDEWQRYVSQSTETQVAEGVLVKELRSLLDSKKAMKIVVDADPDLVVGGPPCQGFSLAGKRNPEDIRNQLPWQFLELVEKSKPKMVVIENVVGMRHKFSADDNGDVFNQLQQALRETRPGYVVQGVQVNALHFGAPQHRPRLMIIGLRKDIAEKKKITSSGALWSSDFIDNVNGVIPPLAPIPTIRSEEIRTVGEAINDLQAKPRKLSRGTGFLAEMSPNYWGLNTSGEITNHVDRVHQDKTQSRFRLYQYLASQGIDARIVGIASEKATAAERKTIEAKLSTAVLPAKSPDGRVLATTKNDLVDLICELRTKKHSQRVLNWSEPARTVVTIGDDYVHPFEPRTFTVRELARFQGFPNGFEFRAKETTGGLNRRTDVPQYSQVGNAVSPFLARAVGKLVHSLLN